MPIPITTNASPVSLSLRLHQDAADLARSNQQIVRPAQIDVRLPQPCAIASAAASPAASGISGRCDGGETPAASACSRRALRPAAIASCDLPALVLPFAHRQKRQTRAQPHCAQPPTHRCLWIRLPAEKCSLPAKMVPGKLCLQRGKVVHAYAGSATMLIEISAAFAECVSAPTLMKSAPASA